MQVMAVSFFLVTVMPGCGKEELPEHYSVSGQVLDSGGSPIEGVQAYFWATTEKEKHQGRYGGGITDAEGKFSVTSNANVTGLAAGEYKVTFMMTMSETGQAAKPSESDDVPSAPFSEVYGDLEKTPETVKVTEGDIDFTFRLN